MKSKYVYIHYTIYNLFGPAQENQSDFSYRGLSRICYLWFQICDQSESSIFRLMLEKELSVKRWHVSLCLLLAVLLST